MTKHELNEKALTAAIAAAADCRWMFTRQEGRADMAAIIRAYLDAMPKPAPEEKRDRIAVVVDVDGRGNAWFISPGDDDPNDTIWKLLAGDGLGIGPPFECNIVRCNLKRPSAPVEVDGEVER